MDEFDFVYNAAKELNSGLRLPHEAYLYRTKFNTGHEHDVTDQLFLESMLKAHFRE